jgi:nitroreductase
MEFADVLRGRRMVRNYSDESVSRDAVEWIVTAGTKAPRGEFSQGARLGVVTIGHPADEPLREWTREAIRRRRRPLDEVVRWERW